VSATDSAGPPSRHTPLAHRFGLSPPVWRLGWVSFFTDTAGEMIYPLLPLFLTQTLRAGAMSIGVIEGVAEAANSLLKMLSGWLTDRWGVPKRLVLAGYSLSSAARPLIAIANAWPQVLLIRFSDRLGKGIRSSPRDAMLASYAAPHLRGRVYGFHQAMDHAGAVFGPLIAALYLYFRPADYRTLFAWTIVPGVIVVLLILGLPDDRRPAAQTGAGARGPARAGERARGDARERARGSDIAAGSLGRDFHVAIAIVFLFSLGNATDAFLLLRLSNEGIPSAWIPLLWALLHVVKMTSSVVGGVLSDTLGRRLMIALGYLWYAAIYFAFGYFSTAGVTIAVFLAYGLYFGLTEGVEKAWVADLVPAERRGLAFGVYNSAIGFGSLAASLIFGLLWVQVSPRAAFVTGAALALGASVLLATVFPRKRSQFVRA
jgi:MFS family permease